MAANSHFSIIRKSTVKLTIQKQVYDPELPGYPPIMGNLTGSGVMISSQGKIRLLTAAHFLEDATYIVTRLSNDTKTYKAKCVFIGHDCGLGMLEVTDPEFLKNVVPLPIAGLKKHKLQQYESKLGQEKLSMCFNQLFFSVGFPVGGSDLCISKGVISRVEQKKLPDSKVISLIAQIDASIHPGVVGGPVLNSDNELVGINARGYSVGNNISYMVPSVVINRFLKDCSTGVYRGVPTLCFNYQPLRFKTLRKIFESDLKHKDKNYYGAILNQYRMPNGVEKIEGAEADALAKKSKSSRWVCVIC